MRNGLNKALFARAVSNMSCPFPGEGRALPRPLGRGVLERFVRFPQNGPDEAGCRIVYRTKDWVFV